MVAIFDNENCDERVRLDFFSRQLFEKRHDIILHDKGQSFLADVIENMNRRMKDLHEINDEQGT